MTFLSEIEIYPMAQTIMHPYIIMLVAFDIFSIVRLPGNMGERWIVQYSYMFNTRVTRKRKKPSFDSDLDFFLRVHEDADDV